MGWKERFLAEICLADGAPKKCANSTQEVPNEVASNRLDALHVAWVPSDIFRVSRKKERWPNMISCFVILPWVGYRAPRTRKPQINHTVGDNSFCSTRQNHCAKPAPHPTLELSQSNGVAPYFLSSPHNTAQYLARNIAPKRVVHGAQPEHDFLPQCPII